jgi:DNA repair protein RecN (Recombination protein N)
MLKEIRIENFAIIDNIELSFADGLVIFTGETGAGKSIIMDALETILGGRAEFTQIRTGAEQANLEATFQLSGKAREPVHEILKREDLLDDPDYLILGREIRRNNRNIARINGRNVGAALLREIGEFLVDIHGQSEHLSLLRIRHHQELLDRYCGLEETLLPYTQTYKQLKQVRHELESLRQAERDSARRIDLLTYQINEIEAANLTPGEEQELNEEHNRLANAEELTRLISEALQLIDETSPENPTISDFMGNLVSSLENLAHLDRSQSGVSTKAALIFEEISELSAQLRDYQETIEFNPKRLAQVEERIGLITNLKRKYGDTIESVLTFAEKARLELDSIVNAGERIQTLEAEQDKLSATLAQQGLNLSAKRHAAAQQLQSALENELVDLKMAGARFQVDFKRRPDPNGILLPDGERVAFDVHGIEQIEFLIEPNPGEGFKPLVKIASGGETSRFMLALKNLLAQADYVPTLVFDEIDQGIGGRVGSIVGQKLWLLASQHQVMCITHLPQLAAFGEQHFRVEKAVDSGRTTTQVHQIEGEKRIEELAQMLGEVSNGMILSARELMDTVSQITQTATTSKP